MQRRTDQLTTTYDPIRLHEPVLHRARILCIDDAPDIACLLARLIRKQPGLEDAGSIDTVTDVISEVTQREADIVIIDLTIPGESPLDAIRELAKHERSCSIIAFSGHDDSNTRDAALAAGACEFVSKNTEPAGLIDIIRRVACQRLTAE